MPQVTFRPTEDVSAQVPLGLKINLLTIFISMAETRFQLKVDLGSTMSIS